MSANRSVQAAQRRRAGPSNNEPAIPGRGPQPSINTAQMFANQAKPGSGPSIPSGRMAGQQLAMQQQQMQASQNNKLSSVTKMTIPQAITLITLRLGVIEAQLMKSGYSNNMSFNGESGIDAEFLQSIMTRLKELENRPTSSPSNALGPELNLMKQQFETFKQTVLQTKTATSGLVKENNALKTQVENMRKELAETKELVAALQNLTMDNSQQILELSMGATMQYTDEACMCRFSSLQEGLTDGNYIDLQDDNEKNEIVETDLNQLIQSELNT